MRRRGWSLACAANAKKGVLHPAKENILTWLPRRAQPLQRLDIYSDCQSDGQRALEREVDAAQKVGLNPKIPVIKLNVVEQTTSHLIYQTGTQNAWWTKRELVLIIKAL